MNFPEQTPQSPASTAPAIDEALERRRAQQSLPAGIGAGLVAAFVGAVVWAAITYATDMQIGWMAVGVGFLVGYAMRFGRGIDSIFKICGATLALCGCLLGNLFTIYAYAAKGAGMGVFEVISGADFGKVLTLMGKNFSPMDLLFYGLAAYGGWRNSTLRGRVQT